MLFNLAIENRNDKNIRKFNQIQIRVMNKNFSISTPSDFNFKKGLRFLQRSDLECLFRIENGLVQFALKIKNENFVIQFFLKNGNSILRF